MLYFLLFALIGSLVQRYHHVLLIPQQKTNHMVTISITNLREEWANIEIEITHDDELLFDNTTVMPGGQTVTIEDVNASGHHAD